jgi:raffinose/stachyose/melibiose transport system substrate-binding protein
MRRKISLLVLIIFSLVLSSCVSTGRNSDDSDDAAPRQVSLEVVTTFSGTQSNAANFRNLCQEWEIMTGYQLVNHSAISDDAFKAKVAKDFETSSEPDVLYFFYGADANPFIEAGKVVSIAEIRQYYPDYAMNMDPDLVPVSLVDGKAYAVPVTGFWEALFINTEILENAGVAIPGDDYTWEQFLMDCEAIKESGYIPIAAALGHIPHYWWEYTVFNHNTLATHLIIPEHINDEQGLAWLRGMRDIQEMYNFGYFPENTFTITDDESFNLFIRGQAAFLLDGSWKLGDISNASLDEAALAKFDVTFFPTRGERLATDMIGGLSMGYYITRKAWDNPEKRAAAVSFVMHMTSTEAVLKFAQHTATALAEEPDFTANMEYNSLQTKAINMVSRATSYTNAVQDLFQGNCREPIFDGLPDILMGDVSMVDAVITSLDLYAQTKR